MASRPLIVIDAPALLPPLARALEHALQRPVLPIDPAGLDLSRIPLHADALLELRLPDGDGLMLAHTLQTRCPSIRILLWSLRLSPLDLWLAWRLGLAGCLDKAEPWERLVESVRRMEAREPVWTPAQLRTIQAFEAEVGERLRRLRSGDWEKLADLARFPSWKERAAAWGMSRDGARRAIARLCARLEIEDPEALIRWALRHGLLEWLPEGPRLAPGLTALREAGEGNQGR